MVPWLMAMPLPDSERVDRRAEHAAAGAQKDDRRADDAVEAGRHHSGRQQQVERNRFLAHAVRRTADGEDEHQDRYEHEFVALELLHQCGDAGIQRARLGHDPQETTQDQHEQAHGKRIGEALDGRRRHVGDGCALDSLNTG